MKSNTGTQLTLIESDCEQPSVELDKPVSLIHMTNNMSASSRKGFNSILLLAKQQLTKNKEDSLARVDIHWNDFKRIMHLKHRTQKHALEKLQELSKITVEIDVLGAECIRKELRSLQLVSEVRIGIDDDGETLVTIFLPPTIRERLRDSDLRAVLNMNEMGCLNTKFAAPLYELAKDALRGNDSKTAEFEYDIDVFKKILHVGTGYTRTYDLQKRCIDTGIEEIEKSSNMRLSYSLIKRGRGDKVLGIKFIVTIVEKSDEEALQFQILFNEVLVLVRPGYIENDQVCNAVERALREKGYEYTVSNINYANDHSSKNYVKYLKDCLDVDYAINERVKKLQQEKTVRVKRDETANLELELQEKKEKRDAKLVANFEKLSEVEKDEVYALIEQHEKVNPFLRQLSSVQQLVFILNMIQMDN